MGAFGSLLGKFAIEDQFCISRLKLFLNLIITTLRYIGGNYAYFFKKIVCIKLYNVSHLSGFECLFNKGYKYLKFNINDFKLKKLSIKDLLRS